MDQQKQEFEKIVADLYRISATILVTPTALSPYIREHEDAPKEPPVRWWRYIRRRIYEEVDMRRKWAIEVGQLAQRATALRCELIDREQAIHFVNDTALGEAWKEKESEES